MTGMTRGEPITRGRGHGERPSAFGDGLRIAAFFAAVWLVNGVIVILALWGLQELGLFVESLAEGPADSAPWHLP